MLKKPPSFPSSCWACSAARRAEEATTPGSEKDPERVQAMPDLTHAERDEFIVDTNLPTGAQPS